MKKVKSANNATTQSGLGPSREKLARLKAAEIRKALVKKQGRGDLGGMVYFCKDRKLPRDRPYILYGVCDEISHLTLDEALTILNGGDVDMADHRVGNLEVFYAGSWLLRPSAAENCECRFCRDREEFFEVKESARAVGLSVWREARGKFSLRIDGKGIAVCEHHLPLRKCCEAINDYASKYGCEDLRQVESAARAAGLILSTSDQAGKFSLSIPGGLGSQLGGDGLSLNECFRLVKKYSKAAKSQIPVLTSVVKPARA